MSLEQIDKALTEADVKFDFVGFDACLMSTTETGLMLAEHADYMIASEESEPGIGWYYTDWLNALSKNTSLPTVEIGKKIADSFVKETEKRVPNQDATLSVIDLAEREYYVPEKLSAFAKSADQMLAQNEFRTIAKARSGAREFATESHIDMIDLVDMTSRIDTPEAKELTQALLSCVKYNNVSKRMSNCYGLSIYFPYRSLTYLNTVLKTYDEIDMEEDYSSLVRNFASYAAGGQVSSGGNTNPYGNISSGSYSNSYYGSQDSSDLIYELLGAFLGGDPSYQQNSSYSSYYDDGFSWLFGRSLDTKRMAEYLSENHFDADLNWKDGKIALTPKQWELVETLKLNCFVDDGTGYIDLGTDNVFEISDKGELLKPEEMTWLAVSNDDENWQVVSYYHVSDTIDGEHYEIRGRIPCLLNGELAELVVSFSDTEDFGKVTGAVYKYEDTDTVGKTVTELKEDDKIRFVCDYYDYDGNYQDSYPIGQEIVYGNGLKVGDIDISEQKVFAMYQFTDVYQQNYWSAPIGQ